MLQAFARVRLLTAINLVGIALAVGLGVVLIPSYGALGAAWTITGTVIAHKGLVHAGLGLDTGVSLFETRYAGVYASVAVALLVLAGLQLAGANTAVMIAAVAVVSVALARFNRAAMEIGDAFPQLARVPLLRHVVGVQFG